MTRKSSRKPRADVRIRTLKEDDFDALIEMCRLIYPRTPPYEYAHYRSQMRMFGEGQLIAEEKSTGRVVGWAASLIVNWDDYEFDHNWDEFTDNGLFTNHDPDGRTLYGADLMVHPDMQGRGVGKAIYQARRDLCRRLKLLRIRAGARLSGYHRYQDTMSPEQYVIAVVRGEVGDPTLTFQLRQGFRVIAVTHGYIPHDPRSQGYAAVIEWINHKVATPRDYRHRDPRFARPRRKSPEP